MIKTGIKGLRDPFILLKDGIYYMYGTGASTSDWNTTEWACYVNTSGTLDGEWKRTEGRIYEIPRFATKQFWAPEVHEYKGAFYLIASYYSEATGFRGSSILRSDSPTGPFTEISDGHITPHTTDCIDASLYLDESGQPWLVFVDEWTSTPDGIGRMAVAKISDDLTHLISDPCELFRADAPKWSTKGVTDGCFLYKTSGGKLVMLWSNFDKDGYCLALAHSENGRPDGKWVQDDEPILTKSNLGGYDGGHGMLFRALDGKLYTCLHSPNAKTKDGECEEVVIIPIDDTGDTLVPKLD